jgi:hypothetical protein
MITKAKAPQKVTHTDQEIGEAFFDVYFEGSMAKQGFTEGGIASARGIYASAFAKNKTLLRKGHRLSEHDIYMDVGNGMTSWNYATQNKFRSTMTQSIFSGIQQNEMPDKVAKRLQKNSQKGGPVITFKKVAVVAALGIGSYIAYDGHQAREEAAAANQALLDAAKNNTEMTVGAVEKSTEATRQVEAAVDDMGGEVSSQMEATGKDVVSATGRGARRVVKTLENGIQVEVLTPTDSVPGPALVPNAP